MIDHGVQLIGNSRLGTNNNHNYFLIQKWDCSALQYNPGYYILVQLINVNCMHQYQHQGQCQ